MHQVEHSINLFRFRSIRNRKLMGMTSKINGFYIKKVFDTYFHWHTSLLHKVDLHANQSFQSTIKPTSSADNPSKEKSHSISPFDWKFRENSIKSCLFRLFDMIDVHNTLYIDMEFITIYPPSLARVIYWVVISTQIAFEMKSNQFYREV